MPTTGSHAERRSEPEATRPAPTLHALRYGLRGLSGRDSLAQLLARERGVRDVGGLPELTEENILLWADQYRERTGRWPTENSGPIADAPGETWANVTAALMQGLRGFPGGSSLAVLIATRRGVRNLANIPRLTIKQILGWVDTHRAPRSMRVE